LLVCVRVEYSWVDLIDGSTLLAQEHPTMESEMYLCSMNSSSSSSIGKLSLATRSKAASLRVLVSER
jgi:hypothetical protein